MAEHGSDPVTAEPVEGATPVFLSDGGAVLVAGAAAFGAWQAIRVPLLITVVGLAVALVCRKPLLLALAVFLLTSALAARSWSSLSPPQRESWHGVVALASDPERIAGATRAVVRLDGHRMEVWARGEQARALRPLLFGDRVVMTGTVSPLPQDQRQRLGAKHIVGRFTISKVGDRRPTPMLWRAANGIRELLARGSDTMPSEQRALLAGLVFGDDRAQSTATKDAYRAAGLTHLLAVSGQNVAFVLAVAAPLLRRLPQRTRWVVTLVLLGFFAVVTRFEPSVIRATLMAGFAVTAAARGRPTSSVRLLSLATVAALVIDPLLIWQVGFQLSVLATAGIVVLSGRLASLLPGPRFLALATSVTLGAQLATAPLLIMLFGGVPVVALPANLLAAPAAGAAMTYGLAGGLAAGILGGRAAAIIHLPTRVLLGWIDLVARRGAAANLGTVSAWHLAVGALVATALLIRRRRALRYRREDPTP